MLYYPEFIPFLWLSLVAILVVPLACGAFFCLYKSTTGLVRIFIPKGSTAIFEHAAKQPHPDLRKDQRIPVEPLKVNVTDGRIFSPARLKNISKRGVCLEQIPSSLYQSQECLTIYSGEHKTLPTIHIYPKWQKKTFSGKTMGAAIVATSREWAAFLKEYSPLEIAPTV